jgi:transcriptional regulator with XRE-family HTH domain
MQNMLKRLGRAVQRLRRDAGYSQESLAETARMHRTYVGAIERGEKNISLSNLERLATALGIRPSELLVEAEKER